MALITAAFMVCAAVLLPGFWARIAVLLALVFGFLLSWLFDAVFGTINSIVPALGPEATDHDRLWAWDSVSGADWVGFPSGTLADGVDVVHGPSFSLTFILLVLPGVIALIAENIGLVEAVAGHDAVRTSTPTWAARVAADGVATALASAVRRLHPPPPTPRTSASSVRRVSRRPPTYAGVVGGHPAWALPEVRRGRRPRTGGVLGASRSCSTGVIGLLGAKIWMEEPGPTSATRSTWTDQSRGIIIGSDGRRWTSPTTSR